MEWTKAVRQGDYIQIPKRWLHLHYYEALNILFRIENALRVFVYVVLKDALRDDWSNCNLAGDEGQEGSIKSIARRRISQAATFGYIGHAVACPIMFLTSGEMIRLITSDAYWKHFAPHFLGAKEIIKNKLDEIGAIRNALAHFRPIKEDDVEVIKQNAKHVLMNIETKLQRVLRCAAVVPTNTTDTWYSVLSTLGTDLCTLRFFQSEDEQWVRIALTYRCPIVGAQAYSPQFIVYQVLGLVSPQVLKNYPVLATLVIYLSEYVPLPAAPSEGVPDFRKELWLVFSRQTLIEKHAELKGALEELLSVVSKESELIKQDHLARGSLVAGVATTAALEKGEDKKAHWYVNVSNLHQPVREGDPVEYWGSFQFWIDDFIAGTERYPWMPASVSESDIPF